MCRRSLATTAQLFLSSVLVACGGHSVPQPSPLPPPIRVTVQTPQRRDLARTLALPATLQAHWETSLYAKVPGYLKELRVDRGDRVAKGQVLAVLEIPEMARERQQAEAQVGVAEAQAKLTAETEKRLTAILSESKDALTGQEVDEAKAKRHSAIASLDLARATRDRVDALMAYAEIRAPFDGVVTDRFADLGELIDAPTSNRSSAKPILKVSAVEPLRVFVDVPEKDVPSIQVGASATVTVDAYPGESFAARVTRFDAALNPGTRTMRVELSLPSERGRLRPGMFGQASITLAVHEGALVLPPAALQGEKSTRFVYVVSDGKAQKRKITAGLDDGKSVEIVEGISPEDQVVVQADRPLNEGAPVSVTGEKASS